LGISFAAPGIAFPVLRSKVMSASKVLMMMPISLTNEACCGSMLSGSAAIRVLSSPFGSASAAPPVVGPPPGVQADTTRAKRAKSAIGQMRLRVRVKIPPPSSSFFLLGYVPILGHSWYRR
jgi:hypothetical protein